MWRNALKHTLHVQHLDTCAASLYVVYNKGLRSKFGMEFACICSSSRVAPDGFIGDARQQAVYSVFLVRHEYQQFYLDVFLIYYIENIIRESTLVRVRKTSFIVLPENNLS